MDQGTKSVATGPHVAARTQRFEHEQARRVRALASPVLGDVCDRPPGARAGGERVEQIAVQGRGVAVRGRVERRDVGQRLA